MAGISFENILSFWEWEKRIPAARSLCTSVRSILSIYSKDIEFFTAHFVSGSHLIDFGEQNYHISSSTQSNCIIYAAVVIDKMCIRRAKFSVECSPTTTTTFMHTIPNKKVKIPNASTNSAETFAVST